MYDTRDSALDRIDSLVMTRSNRGDLSLPLLSALSRLSLSLGGLIIAIIQRSVQNTFNISFQMDLECFLAIQTQREDTSICGLLSRYSELMGCTPQINSIQTFLSDGVGFMSCTFVLVRARADV